MKKIVFLGGGGGVTNIAKALRDDYFVTAIMTTFDDGGSYGRLRQEFKTPLSGDIRRAFSALSTNQLGHWNEHRFAKGDVKGHTLGNLICTSVFEETEDPQKAMEILHDLFEVKGRVLGVSYHMAELQAELMDRTILRGEHVIDEPHAKSHIRIRRVWLDPDPQPAPGVLQAIAEADLIIMGPGDVYTSTVPCLLVPGVAEAIQKAKAKTVYFVNAFTVYGQTNRFTAFDHVKAIEEYLGPHTIDLAVLDSSKFPEEVVQEHCEREEMPVAHDTETLESAGYQVQVIPMIDEKLYQKSSADTLKRSMIRMNPEKLRSFIQSLF